MLKIIGVHPVEAPEPCHIIVVELTEPPGEEFDFGEFTQEVEGEPRSDWQVAYDERPLDDSLLRWAFFFHYLDFQRLLMTPFGKMILPRETPIPSHLKDIEYWPPG
jgi:hypothetical protein